MNRLMLASLSVFALTITAPSMQDPIAATPPARDLNPQVSNNPLIDSRLVIATRPSSGDNNLSDRGNRTAETSNIITAGHSAGDTNSQDLNNASDDGRNVSGC